MNNGLWVAASGMFANMYRQDVAANNMANLNTAGFKPEVVSMQWRDPERIEDHVPTDPNLLLEGLGGGLLVAPVKTSWHRQGNIVKTGNELDVALTGKGYLAFEGAGATGQERMRLSRDGRLTLDREGYLVHTGTGLKVMDESGEAIQLGNGTVTIRDDGSIEQNGATVGRLRIVTAPESGLRKTGGNMMRLEGEVRLEPGEAEVHQGAVEGSAADPIQSLMEMTNATSAVSANARMVRIFDETMDAAINRFGRVA